MFLMVDNTYTDCGCRNQCLEKFTIEDRVALLDSLYNGRPKTEFDLHLIKLITRHETRKGSKGNKGGKDYNGTQRRKGGQSYKDGQRRRSCTFTYSVMKGSQRVAVCRKAFILLHAVSSKALYRLTDLLANGFRCPEGLRGASSVPSSEITLHIDSHIRSFPGHFIERPATYLGAQLTVRSMYKLFCTRFPELKEAVGYDCYLRYFKEHYGRPYIIEN